MNKKRLVGVVLSWAVAAVVGCSPAPGMAPTPVGDVPGDVGDAAEIGATPDVPGDASGGLDGDWRVTSWRASRAIGANKPMPEDGGTENPVCADNARTSYAVMAVSVRGGDATVSINGSDCEATASGTMVTARCNCGSSFIVCSSVIAMVLDGATLRGEQRLDFNRPGGPAYCAVNATFEASRR
jgi:hypothetical protein